MNTLLLHTTGLAVLAVSLFPLAACSQQPETLDSGPVTTWSPTDAIARMEQLGIPFIPGRVQTYYSDGAQDRGEELQGHLEAALDFFGEIFDSWPEVALAILDPTDWPRVTPMPYAFPHPYMGSPNLVFLGATYDNLLADYSRSRLEYISAENYAKVQRAGLTWDEASGRLLDLVGFHELGHVYTGALGIKTHRRWFSEMMASYFSYAFMRSERPELALVWEATLSIGIDEPAEAHTTLADFERLYIQVGLANYQWYQSVFQQRVEEVYEAQGIDFIHRVREAFPIAAEDELTTEELLERLEAIQPGFYEWVERFNL